jgi:hypothetical protein
MDPGLLPLSPSHTCSVSFGAGQGAERTAEESVMEKMRGGFRTLRAVSLAAVMVGMLGSTAQAGPLGVPTDPFPAILAGFISTSFNINTGELVATGWTQSIIDQTGEQSLPGQFTTNFSVRATLETVGGVTRALSGSLQIGPSTNIELHSNSLINFGYDPLAGGTIEFLFQPVSGDLVDSGMFLANKPIDVLLYGLGPRFPGRFTSSFVTSGGSAWVKVDPPPAPVPEPGKLTLMLLAAGGLFVQGRWRSGAPPAAR